MISSTPTSASSVPDVSAGWGLIAGNGQFPFLVLEAARDQGIDMAVIAIREEASPELEKVAARLHWVSLGELSRTLELLHQEGVTRAVMAGQVKHNKIFSSIRPDWKLAKLLLSDETVLRSFAPVLKKRTDHQDAKDTRVAIDQSPQGFSLGAPGVLVVLSPLAKLP